MIATFRPERLTVPRQTDPHVPFPTTGPVFVCGCCVLGGWGRGREREKREGGVCAAIGHAFGCCLDKGVGSAAECSMLSRFASRRTLDVRHPPLLLRRGGLRGAPGRRRRRCHSRGFGLRGRVSVREREINQSTSQLINRSTLAASRAPCLHTHMD